MAKFTYSKSNFKYNRGSNWNVNRRSSRSNFRALVASQQRDNAKFTINVPTKITVFNKYETVPTSAVDPTKTKTINIGTYALNIYELLRKSEFFQNYAGMFDEFKINGIRVKLTPSSYVISSGQRYQAITVFTAWDRTGLEESQIFMNLQNTTDQTTELGTVTNRDGIYVTVGDDVTTYSSAYSKSLNPNTNTSITRTLEPKSLMEKAQYISTDSLKQWYTGFDNLKGRYYGVPVTGDSTQLVGMGYGTNGGLGWSFSAIKNSPAIKDNPCFLVEDNAIAFKPTLIVGIYPQDTFEDVINGNIPSTTTERIPNPEYNNKVNEIRAEIAAIPSNDTINTNDAKADNKWGTFEPYKSGTWGSFTPEEQLQWKLMQTSVTTLQGELLDIEQYLTVTTNNTNNNAVNSTTYNPIVFNIEADIDVQFRGVRKAPTVEDKGKNEEIIPDPEPSDVPTYTLTYNNLSRVNNLNPPNIDIKSSSNETIAVLNLSNASIYDVDKFTYFNFGMETINWDNRLDYFISKTFLYPVKSAIFHDLPLERLYLFDPQVIQETATITENNGVYWVTTSEIPGNKFAKSILQRVVLPSPKLVSSINSSNMGYNNVNISRNGDKELKLVLTSEQVQNGYVGFSNELVVNLNNSFNENNNIRMTELVEDSNDENIMNESLIFDVDGIIGDSSDSNNNRKRKSDDMEVDNNRDNSFNLPIYKGEFRNKIAILKNYNNFLLTDSNNSFSIDTFNNSVENIYGKKFVGLRNFSVQPVLAHDLNDNTKYTIKQNGVYNVPNGCCGFGNLNVNITFDKTIYIDNTEVNESLLISNDLNDNNKYFYQPILKGGKYKYVFVNCELYDSERETSLFINSYVLSFNINQNSEDFDVNFDKNVVLNVENTNAVGFYEDNNGYYINASVPSNLNVYAKYIKQYIDNINFRNVIDDFEDLRTIFNNNVLEIYTSGSYRLGGMRAGRCENYRTYNYNSIVYLNDYEYVEGIVSGFSGPAVNNYYRNCGKVHFIRCRYDYVNDYWNISFGAGYSIEDYYFICRSGIENNTEYSNCIKINGVVIPFVDNELKIRFFNDLQYEIINDNINNSE